MAINVPLLDKVLDLRRQIAKLLGYETWADYITEVKMIKNAAGVTKVPPFLFFETVGTFTDTQYLAQFLDDLQEKLSPVGLNNRDTLLELKKKEHAEKGYPFDGEFYLWDYRYYDQKFIQSSLDLDEKSVKEYFPVSVIVPQIIQIYQNLLSIKFVEMEGKTWHTGDPSALGFTC